MKRKDKVEIVPGVEAEVIVNSSNNSGNIGVDLEIVVSYPGGKTKIDKRFIDEGEILDGILFDVTEGLKKFGKAFIGFIWVIKYNNTIKCLN